MDIGCIEDKPNVYIQSYVCRVEDCMKECCKSVDTLQCRWFFFEKKKKIPLTNKQQESYEKTKICRICKKKSKVKRALPLYWYILGCCT